MSISPMDRAGVSGVGIERQEQMRALLPLSTTELSFLDSNLIMPLVTGKIQHKVITWSSDIYHLHHLQEQKRYQPPPSDAPAQRNAEDPKITKLVSSKQKAKTTSAVQQTMFKSYIREDFLPSIGMNLPHWKEHGLWSPGGGGLGITLWLR